MNCGICRTLYPDIVQEKDEICLECRAERICAAFFEEPREPAGVGA